MKTLVLLASFIVLSSAQLSSFLPTALDIYVDFPDFTYRWSLHSSFRDGETTVYVINMTSQTYDAPYFNTNHPVWSHWLTICVPDNINSHRGHHGVIYVDEGNIGDAAPTSPEPLTQALCQHTGLITAHLMDIPNEPLIFDNDGVPRTEDGILAFGWAKFLNNTNRPLWITRLPMVKATVRALDTIQDFVASHRRWPRIVDFTVTGASKRGWVTWLMGAVDLRVKAIVPMVMPILNMVPNLNHHFQAYGGWSFALGDYVANHVTNYLNDPVFRKLAAIEDPWSYKGRLSMPKMIICAVGDEFFLPDSAQFFLDGLVGEWHLTMIPNAGHNMGLSGGDAASFNRLATTTGAFINLIASNRRRPSYTYEIHKSNTTASIELWLTSTPSNVTVWQATTISTTLRDFRQHTPLPQDVPWTPTPLAISSSGYYHASVAKPAAGWTGFMIEVIYQYPDDNFVFTTEVNVVPDIMPFPPCGNNC